MILTIQYGLPVARIELLDALQVRAVNAYSRLNLPETPLLLLEFHGTEAAVTEQADVFGGIAAEMGGTGFTFTTRERIARRSGRPAMRLLGGTDAAARRQRGFPPMSACRSAVWPNA